MPVKAPLLSVQADEPCGQGMYPNSQSRAGPRLLFSDRNPNMDHNSKWPVHGRITPSLKPPARTTRLSSPSTFTPRAWQSCPVSEYESKTRHAYPPHASVSPDTKIEYGSIVVAGAVVNIGATIGLGGIINIESSVDHDCVLGNGVHICPGARLAGDVHVGDRSWIDIGAAVRQGIQIGSDVVVGAGAAVVNDVPDELTVVGVPARPLAVRHGNRGS